MKNTQAKKVDLFNTPLPEHMKDVPIGVGIPDFENYIKYHEKEMAKWNRFPMKYTQYHMLKHQYHEQKANHAKARLVVLKYILSKNANVGMLKVVQDPLLVDIKMLKEQRRK